MPYQKSYTDTAGNTFASAYWIVRDIRLDDVNLRAYIAIYAYKDYSSYSTGKTPVGVKTYIVSGSTYTTYFAESVLLANNVSPRTKAYAYAETGTELGGVSYFSGAAIYDTSGAATGGTVT